MIPGQLHILVVDDLVDAADSMVDLLRLWGYDASACYCGTSALVSSCTRRPSIVLLDLAMPRMDGFHFARLFRELPQCEKVPIVVLSGYSGAAYSAFARESGIRHCLLKPTDPGLLRELLAWEVEQVAEWLPGDRTVKGGSTQESQEGRTTSPKRGQFGGSRPVRSGTGQSVPLGGRN